MWHLDGTELIRWNKSTDPFLFHRKLRNFRSWGRIATGKAEGKRKENCHWRGQRTSALFLPIISRCGMLNFSFTPLTWTFSHHQLVGCLGRQRRRIRIPAPVYRHVTFRTATGAAGEAWRRRGEFNRGRAPELWRHSRDEHHSPLHPGNHVCQAQHRPEFQEEQLDFPHSQGESKCNMKSLENWSWTGSIDWLIDSMLNWVDGQSIDWLIWCWIEWTVDWSIYRLIDWLGDWLIDWLINNLVITPFFSWFLKTF